MKPFRDPQDPAMTYFDLVERPALDAPEAFFPNALRAVADHSVYGSKKHNPGEPVHWQFDKSMAHAASAGRHLDARGTIDPETGKSHTIAAAWRALALLETELLYAGAEPGPGVKGYRAPLDRGQA
jgi:hypothetical protein